jgi:hypothetical protein
MLLPIPNQATMTRSVRTSHLLGKYPLTVWPERSSGTHFLEQLLAEPLEAAVLGHYGASMKPILSRE